MPKYATETQVSPERSLEEIRRTLRRYDADEFMFGEQVNKGMVMFKVAGRRVKFIVPLPDPESEVFTTDKRGFSREPHVQKKHWEQAVRQRWRALALAIKAKLEVVDIGISTFEEEFLGHILLPDGKTVAHHIIPAIAQIYKTGKSQKLLLPEFGGE